MKRFYNLIILLSLWVACVSLAEAHAFLDHANPGVGCAVDHSPSEVKIWFTDGLKASSKMEVLDSSGKKVEIGEAKIDLADKSALEVAVPKLPAGSYKVVWKAVCPSGHHTSGSFTFVVKALNEGNVTCHFGFLGQI